MRRGLDFPVAFAHDEVNGSVVGLAWHSCGLTTTLSAGVVKSCQHTIAGRPGPNRLDDMELASQLITARIKVDSA